MCGITANTVCRMPGHWIAVALMGDEGPVADAQWTVAVSGTAGATIRTPTPMTVVRVTTPRVITSSFSVVGVSQAAAGQHLAYAFGVSLPPTMLAWFGSTGTSMTTEFDGANSLTPVVWVLGAVAGLVVSHLAQQSPAAVRKAWLRFIRGADAREANPTCPACEGEGSIDCLCQRWRVPDASSDSSESRSEPKGPLQKASRGWNLFSKSRTRVALTKSTCSRCHGTGREPCPRCGGGGMLVHSDEASLRGDTVPVHLEDGYDWERAARLKRDSR